MNGWQKIRMGLLLANIRLGKITMDAYTGKRDKNPDNWRTIQHSHVHLNENGEIDGGAGGKFMGRKWTSEKTPHKSSSQFSGGGGLSGASSGGGSSGGGESKPKEYKQGDRLSFGDVPQWYLEKNLSYNDRKVFNMLSASGNVDVIGTSEKAVHVDLGGRKLWIPKSIIGREDKTTSRHSAEELSASIKNYRAKGEAYAKQTKGTFKTNPWTSSNGRVKRNYYTIKQKGEKRGKDAGYLDLNTLKYTPGEIDLEK